MFRKLLLTGAFAAVALPAAAQTEVTVKVAGLDAKAAHEAIYHAAQVACRAELADESDIVAFYVRPVCLRAAIADAEAKYAAMRQVATR
jgi:hypothetical protein